MRFVGRRYLLFAMLLATSPLAAQDIQVTLLGTGTPGPIMERFGPSTLIEAGGQVLIVDAGRGASQRLRQIGISYADIDAIFLTHLHSDHVVGLPDLWLVGWLLSNRDQPLQVFGPAGTQDLVSNLREAYAFDIDIRISDDKVPPAGSYLQVTEIEEGLVYEADGVRVVAFDVDHRPISPALGFRFEYNDRKVLLSGDTRYSRNLIDHAADVDLLIHEVAGATPVIFGTILQNSFEHHTTPQQAGEIFSEVRPTLAAYTHLALFGGYEKSRLVPDTRETYDGPLVVGEDLMRFSVGDTVAVEIVTP